MPAVRDGWRKSVASDREYLPLTTDILASHLTGDIDLGLYPLLGGDRCWWLAADFDGSAAMLDACPTLKLPVRSAPRSLWRCRGQARVPTPGFMCRPSASGNGQAGWRRLAP